MPLTTPDDTSRWRCGHCGNLTRFDVVRSRTVAEYWHFSLAGEPEISETGVVAESLDKVVCRWCGATDRVEEVPRPGEGEDQPAELGGP